MWRNYLTVGFRALTRSKTYAFINIFGLALGLAACLMLLIYVRYETGYDRWLPDSGRVYQVQSIPTFQEAVPVPQQGTHGIITESLAHDFPQIEEIVRIEGERPVFLRNGEPSFADMALADENFFRVLQLPFLRGDPATALRGMDSLVLSRSEAINRFGSLDIIGQTVTSIRGGEQSSLRVTGIFEDIPRDSHMNFRMVGRISENDKEYLVSAELPGAKKEDIRVSIDGNYVSIAAEVKKEQEEKHGRSPSMRTISSICGKSWARLSVMIPCVPCWGTGTASWKVGIDWTW